MWNYLFLEENCMILIIWSNKGLTCILHTGTRYKSTESQYSLDKEIKEFYWRSQKLQVLWLKVCIVIWYDVIMSPAWPGLPFPFGIHPLLSLVLWHTSATTSRSSLKKRRGAYHHPWLAKMYPPWTLISWLKL